jgi:hypothetical protein
MKSKNKWGHWVLAFIALLAWVTTFAYGLVDCTIGHIIQQKCEFGWGKQTADLIDVKDIAAIKGQLGDVFGVLNGAFGGLTLFFVYRAYRSERAGSEEQIRFVKLERYYLDVTAAINAYEVALQGVLVPEWGGSDSTAKPSRKIAASWTSRHGIFHLWKTHFTFAAIRHQWAYSADGYDGRRIPGKQWAPIAVQMGFDLTVDSRATYSGSFPESFVSESTVAELLRPNASNTQNFQDLVNAVNGAWLSMYGSNRYQLDFLFRTWYHAFKTIASAVDFEIDEETEWRTASRFRAQLSWIEMVFLLANQTFGSEAGSDRFPKAVELSERYAMFDNFTLGLDPTVHALLAAAKGETKHIKSIFSLDSFESERARKSLRDRRTKQQM